MLFFFQVKRSPLNLWDSFYQPLSSYFSFMESLQLTMAIPDGSEYCNMRDIDINQPAQGLEEQFPTTTKGSREEEGEIVEADEAVAEHRQPIRPKKLQLDGEQCLLLEESFRQNPTPNPRQKEELAMKLELRHRQVEVWFQNRRARTKLKQIEMECEYLRCCFASLTAENRHLQKEVEQLHALRAAPPTVVSPHSFQPVPAPSLTMCPQCQRIATATATNSSKSHCRIPAVPLQ